MVGDGLVGGHVEEDEDRPETNPFVQILRLDLVGKHRAGSYLGSAEEQVEETGLLDLLDVGLSQEIAGLGGEAGEGLHDVFFQGAEGGSLDEEPAQGGAFVVVGGLEGHEGGGVVGGGVGLLDGGDGEGGIVEEDVPLGFDDDPVGCLPQYLIVIIEHAFVILHVIRGDANIRKVLIYQSSTIYFL